MKPYDKLKLEVAEKIASIWRSLSGKPVEVTVRHSPISIRGRLIYASPAAPYILVIRRTDNGKLVVINWTQVVTIEAPEDVKIDL